MCHSDVSQLQLLDLCRLVALPASDVVLVLGECASEFQVVEDSPSDLLRYICSSENLQFRICVT